MMIMIMMLVEGYRVSGTMRWAKEGRRDIIRREFYHVLFGLVRLIYVALSIVSPFFFFFPGLHALKRDDIIYFYCYFLFGIELNKRKEAKHGIECLDYHFSA